MRKPTRITIRLTEPLRKALEARAEREDEFPAEIVRQALVAFLGPVRKPHRSDE